MRLHLLSLLLQGKEKFLGILNKHMEIHSTVYYESQRPHDVPTFVKNHSHLPQPKFQPAAAQGQSESPSTLSSPSWPQVPRGPPHTSARVATTTFGPFHMWTCPSMLCCLNPVSSPPGHWPTWDVQQAGESLQGQGPGQGHCLVRGTGARQTFLSL